MKKLILAWLLFHANKSKDKRFYEIKNRILKKYGNPIGFDIQHIEGKQCFSCGGTGTHHYINWEGEEYDRDTCWHCSGTGWFKRPVWNYLYQIKFGRYVFHQPFERAYIKPEGTLLVFVGYVEHNKTKYTDFALFLLFLAFEKGYLKRYYNESGYGYFRNWLKPHNFINNIIHIMKHKEDSIPFKYPRKRKPQIACEDYRSTNDDLPF